MPRTAFVEAFHGDGPLSGFMRRLGGGAWRARHLISRRGRLADWLDGLVDQGVDCVFICGEGEAQPFLQSPHLDRHRRRAEHSAPASPAATPASISGEGSGTETASSTIRPLFVSSTKIRLPLIVKPYGRLNCPGPEPRLITVS